MRHLRNNRRKFLLELNKTPSRTPSPPPSILHNIYLLNIEQATGLYQYRYRGLVMGLPSMSHHGTCWASPAGQAHAWPWHGQALAMNGHAWPHVGPCMARVGPRGLRDGKRCPAQWVPTWQAHVGPCLASWASPRGPQLGPTWACCRGYM